MALTPWQIGRGISSGRIIPTGIAAPAGDYVMCLGNDLPGVFVWVDIGDSVSVAQTANIGDTRVLRVRVRTRAADQDLTGKATWQWFIQVEGVAYAQGDIVGRDQVFDDIAIGILAFANSSAEVKLVLTLGDSGGLDDGEYVELPAVYFDSVIFEDDGLDLLYLCRRQGEPNETGVLVDAPISIGLADSSTEDVPTFDSIYVNGVLAYDGGDQNGFACTFTGLGDGNSQIEITPPAPFESRQVVTVRAMAISQGSAPPIDETYSFTCQDLDAPVLASAEGRDLLLARVVFDEAVLMIDAEGETDALNPANYSFLGIGVPTAEVTPVSVAIVDTQTVEITVDIAFSPGMIYQVTADNIADIFGNEISTPSSVEFTAFVLPKPEGRDFDLYKKIGRISRVLDSTLDLQKFIACLQDVFDLILYDIDRWTEIIDPDLAPEDAVDLMLLDLGNPFNFELSLVDKRRLIRVLVTMYKQKGTGVGIENVIRFFMALEVEVVAWLDSGLSLGESELGIDWELAPGTSRDRYSYEILAPVILTDEQRAQMTQIAEYMQPAHTHLRQIVEPGTVEEIDHLELGLSELGGDEWQLH